MDSSPCIKPNIIFWAFPDGSDSKESACNAGDPGLIPESGRSSGERNGYPLQDSCLENPMDRGAWQAAYSPWGHRELDTTEATKYACVPLKIYTYISNT